MPVAYYNALLHSYQIAVDVAEGNEGFFDSVKEELLYIYQTNQDIGWGFSEGTMDIFCQVS
ncbi:hypothetical protein E4T82_00165 [Streptococcus cuniculi]|uniref:Uncharacterized protein n=2 Tax=Streptococcus cuniculi TaxID=1432788 RepID=A0A4Y9JCL4_9STRE|nr:hypothetical protein [Streptococcus cuniculi]TFU98760.1 hypothetical protein E4T82_00165 [Streptococcus cuniculi]